MLHPCHSCYRLLVSGIASTLLLIPPHTLINRYVALPVKWLEAEDPFFELMELAAFYWRCLSAIGRQPLFYICIW